MPRLGNHVMSTVLKIRMSEDGAYCNAYGGMVP